ncbi:LAMI_0H07470g1_1 [Lachancea mirantina]|uniref:LAMI_0H07470g1_1 n=1 Tax=Lachancea mirantina TaxID=1230905 RepID=A0A1G4KFT6_9SACH|nr:LAMI_0H07470g1_1 [Lachancea mirantina]
MSKDTLLSKIAFLCDQIDEYFDLDLSSAHEKYQLQNRGNSTVLINAAAIAKEKRVKWLRGIHVSYDAAERQFFRCWDLLQNNPELDICLVKDSLGNARLFQIHKLGSQLECVCLTQNELGCLRNGYTGFLTALEKRRIAPESFENFVLWQDTLASGGVEYTEQIPRLFWNKTGYRLEEHCYRVASANAKRLKNFAVYCKFFTRRGFCSNTRCQFVHDPRTISVCQDFYTSGSCPFGDKCRLSHSEPGTENTVPHCKEFLEGRCKYDVGLEGGSACCRFLHSTHVKRDYPICRLFAFSGFCYRGAHCPFRHLWECPDFSNSGVCFLELCRYEHTQRASYLTPLLRIDAREYLLPHLTAGKSHEGSWYGLRTKQQSIDVKSRMSNSTTSPLEKESSHVVLPVENSSDEQDSGSETETDFDEFSDNELDADFIKI